MSLATFFDLTLAAVLGTAIGFERQWNQGVAGLRTNALVAFGAACFVTIGQLVANDTRVAAQIVSGIGFLGAGVIFRAGPSVRGLNTAATIWCSGACGALAGAGLVVEAGYAAIGIIAINLGLHRLKDVIDRRAPHPVEAETDYRIAIECAGDGEAKIRALLLGGISHSGLGLKSLHSEGSGERDGAIRVIADLATHSRRDEAVERIVGQIGAEGGVAAVRWSILDRERPPGAPS
jgi:putative Mg2+ transporter-C (MgtC) family protein